MATQFHGLDQQWKHASIIQQLLASVYKESQC